MKFGSSLAESLYIILRGATFVKHYFSLFSLFLSIRLFIQFVYDILHDILVKKCTLYTNLSAFATKAPIENYTSSSKIEKSPR